MADKEVISLRIASRDITLACPKKDVQGLKEAANILNQEIESIPDKNNAVILAALNVAFKSAVSDSDLSEIETSNIANLISKIDSAIK
ncbi:cell division protein ZapA [SAR86 cluster bacterium]|jgi:cell division protein ZapA (FtsZ GTPase activity inhibitor)|nr:hypothetical protein [Gammaproteobacteria bacterium]URQ70952.1 cell division protein ZapA [SAR86 cluster bacterium]URQ72313.1 cell division protein ZapA [SAR86 cluster bacterium]GIS25717.1 MAG: hypothetical protein CM15mP127_00900 [Gammaproteobacteria bacterium]|tara:strand:- start:51 stop:314 length:264 start_codon:yes stop_codon:yes gene_type:complete